MKNLMILFVAVVAVTMLFAGLNLSGQQADVTGQFASGSSLGIVLIFIIAAIFTGYSFTKRYLEY